MRYSGLRLAGNLAVSLAILAAAAVACQWLFRWYQPRLRWRPRVTTLIMLMIVATPTVLANLSIDDLPTELRDEQTSHGWPFIWYWSIDLSNYAPYHEEWHCDAAALAANLAIWLSMLMATVIVWEWLSRRYWPQSHFSLRTMLVGVGLAAAICAWYVAAREQAAEQDALARLLKYDGIVPVALFDDDDSHEDVWFGVDDCVYVEYRGPQWLDTIGAHRFRRSLVGVRMNVYDSHQDDAAENGALFKRLARMHSLRFLDLQPDDHQYWPRESTPEMTATLSGMHQLRMLNFECHGFEASKVSHTYLAAIGSLSRLERLRLSISADYSNELACLSDLRVRE